jgi:molybdenum cofactor biosynthesis protein B
MSVKQHHKNAASGLRVAIITVSDTRDLASDKSGQLIEKSLTDAGQTVTARTVVPDESPLIAADLRRHLGDESVDAVILNGGTGIARRDGTVEVVRSCLDVELPGFGEIFRQLSYEEIGAAAMLSRAVAGAANGTAVFSLPGSTNAVRLALEKLILPELGHLVSELRK